MTQKIFLAALFLGLAACGHTPQAPRTTGEEAARPPPPPRAAARKPAVALKNGGGYYKDDGPGDEIPENLEEIPDAQPKWEPIHRPATRPYVVLGKEYVPNAGVVPYRARGVASWYGKKFHGQKTSIGEPYDMFAMTAAHPTLALPSYVRVTSVASARSVVVRVTDRGPFHADRLIDLSYTAAYKLGLINGGSGEVEVEAILPGEAVPGPLASGEDELARLSARWVEPEKPTSAPVSNGQALLPRGVYLQLGAFANVENAENLRAHLSRELDWLGEPMRIHASPAIHRLQIGPYASRADAERVAQRIRDALGMKPAVIVR